MQREQARQHPSDRPSLLRHHQDARVLLPRCQPVPVDARKIQHVIRHQHATFTRRKRKLRFIVRDIPRRLRSSQHIHRPPAQPGDQRVGLQILVEIKSDATHGAACACSSARSQARSSAAMSAPISAAFASEYAIAA